MARKYPPPTSVGYVVINGEEINIEDLPPEEWAVYQEKIMERVGKRMSEYYSGLIAQGLM